MSDRTAFLRRRQTGIGGSDVGAIVGVNPHRNILNVWLEKTGEVTDDEPTPIQERGNYLEPIIRELYKRRTGRQLKRAQFRRHRDHKWMIGHTDSLVRAKGDAIRERAPVFDHGGILECKSMMYQVLKKTTEKGVSPDYQLQCQHYMKLCGKPWAAIAMLHPDSWRFAVVNLEADAAVQRQIIELCEQFWYDHVVPRKPPKPRELEWSGNLPAIEGIVEDRTDDEWRQAVADEQERKQMLAEAKALYELSRQTIRELCKRHGVFEGAGARVYFKKRDGNRTLKRDTLDAAGLVDPIKLAKWAAEIEPEYPGLLALLQAGAGGLRADLDELLTKGKPYEDLRIYHILEDQ